MVTIADASRTNLATLILECTANVLRSLTRPTLTDMRIHRLPHTAQNILDMSL
jgi:transcription termination factor NusB